MKSLVLIGITLASCTFESNSIDSNNNNLQQQIPLEDSFDNMVQINAGMHSAHEIQFPENCELMITSYKSDSARKDSTLLCNECLFEDQKRSKEGKCYYRFPFELDAMSLDFFEKLKTEKSTESFDPQICEAGGHSAYNKYKFNDLGNGISEVIHYKAWYEDYDENGNDFTHDTPEYFIGEKIQIYQTDTYTKFEAFDDEGELIESLEYIYNENGLLIRQVWSTYGNEVYLAHYVYNI